MVSIYDVATSGDLSCNCARAHELVGSYSRHDVEAKACPVVVLASFSLLLHTAPTGIEMTRLLLILDEQCLYLSRVCLHCFQYLTIFPAVLVPHL